MKKKLRYFLLSLVILFAGVFTWAYRADIPVEKLKVRYAPPPSEFVSMHGMQVHYREEGKGTPLVLIHGTGASLHTWQGWVEELKPHFRIIRFDLPAFGLTGPHPQHDYKISTYVKFVHDLLQKKGIEKCHIAGNSLGGNIAWRFALAYPEKVDKMILLDASGIPLKKRKKIGIMQLARMPVINQLMRYATPRAIFRKNLLEVYSNDAKVTPELVTQYQELMLREGNRDAFIYRAKTPFEDRSQALKNIQTNTLIMWGKEDAWVPLELAYVFKEKLPHNQFIVYPNVGHVPMEEIPVKTAQDALRFLKATADF